MKFKLMTDCDCYICKTPFSQLTPKQREMACAPIHGHPTLLGFVIIVALAGLLSYGLIHWLGC